MQSRESGWTLGEKVFRGPRIYASVYQSCIGAGTRNRQKGTREALMRSRIIRNDISSIGGIINDKIVTET
jgi:hypothetical protein